MFGGYFLNIHDTSGSETDVNFQRMCQKFILQKERQVFIKCILRNVHNSYVFVHIGRRYCGRETVTPSIQKKNKQNCTLFNSEFIKMRVGKNRKEHQSMLQYFYETGH